MSKEFLQKMHKEAMKNKSEIDYKAEHLQEFVDEYFTKKYKNCIDTFLNCQIYDIVKSYAKAGKNVINAKLRVDFLDIEFKDEDDLKEFDYHVYMGKEELQHIDKNINSLVLNNMMHEEKLKGKSIFKVDNKIMVKPSKEVIEHSARYTFDKLKEFGFNIIGYQDIKLSDREYTAFMGEGRFRESCNKEINMILEF